jgi:hypothetical protein
MGKRLVYNGPRYGALHRTLRELLATVTTTTQPVLYICRTTHLREYTVEIFLGMARAERRMFEVNMGTQTFTFARGASVRFAVPGELESSGELIKCRHDEY